LLVFIDSLTGDRKKVFSACENKMKGHVDDTGAFCNWALSEAGYHRNDDGDWVKGRKSSLEKVVGMGPEEDSNRIKSERKVVCLIYHPLSDGYVYGGPRNWHFREYSYGISKEELDSAIKWCEEQGYSVDAEEEGKRVRAFVKVTLTSVDENVRSVSDLFLLRRVFSG